MNRYNDTLLFIDDVSRYLRTGIDEMFGFTLVPVFLFHFNFIVDDILTYIMFHHLFNNIK